MTIRKHFWAMTALVAFLAVVAPTFDFARAQKPQDVAKDANKTGAAATTPAAAPATPGTTPIPATGTTPTPAAATVADDEDDDDADKDDDEDKDDDADDKAKQDDADDDDDDAANDDGKALESQAKLTFEQARAAALAASPGSAIEEVDLETKHGKLVYEVEMNDKKLHIDATTGAVISTKPRKSKATAAPR